METLFVAPEFSPTNEGIFPIPKAPKPVVTLLLTHPKVAPAVPVKFIAVELCPAQMV